MSDDDTVDLTPTPPLSEAAQRALAEAKARRAEIDARGAFCYKDAQEFSASSS